MKFKPAIAAMLLIICLAMDGCSGADNKQIKATTEYEKSDLSIFTNFSNISYNDNKFYIAKGSSVYIFDSGFEQTGKIVTEISGISALCVSDKKIFISGNAGGDIFIYGINGDFIEKFSAVQARDNMIIGGLLCSNGKLAIKTVQLQNGRENTSLIIYDLADNSFEEHSFDNFTDMSLYDRDNILVRSQNVHTSEVKLYKVSLSDGKKEEVLKLNEVMTGGFCYDSDLKSIFFSGGNNVKRVNIYNGQIQEVFKSNYQIIRNVFTDYEKCYVFDEKTMNVYTIDKKLQTKFVYGVYNNDEKQLIKFFNCDLSYCIDPKADNEGNIYFLGENEIFILNADIEVVNTIEGINGRLYMGLSGGRLYYYPRICVKL